MKLLTCFLSMLLMLFSKSVLAQDAKGPTTDRWQVISKDLGISSEKAKELIVIMDKYDLQLKSIIQSGRVGEERERAIRKILLIKGDEMKTVLTPDEYGKLQSLLREREERMKEASLNRLQRIKEVELKPVVGGRRKI